MHILLLIGGLALLIFGGDYLVKGAVGIASKLNISPMLIGMTVVALGTSAPELVVSVQAALQGKPDISIGNVVGSNIANIGLILGATVLIFPMVIQPKTLRFDWVVMILASLVFIFLGYDRELSQLDGVLLVIGLIAFIIGGIYMARKDRDDLPINPDDRWSWWALLAFVVFGSLGLVLGARWFLDGAETIAKDLGVPDRVIAISLIAFGTSVPELAASVIAAFKKQQEISLGNILGSNIFNILTVLGVTSIIHPIQIADEVMNNDVYWMLGFSAILLPMGLLGFKYSRFDGLVMVLGYVGFMYFLISSL